MEDLISEIGKGFIRVIGHLLAQIFYGTICYWIGWPICKLATLGKYPSSKQAVFLDSNDKSNEGFWCSAVGLTVIVISASILTIHSG